MLGGFALLALGVLMLLLPGPAFVVLPLGLGMLALEFIWAEHALAQVLHWGDKAAAQARKPRSRGMQTLFIAFSLLLLSAVVLGALLFFGVFTLDQVREFLPF